MTRIIPLSVQKIPNILSGFRLLLAPIFLYLFIQDQIFWRAISLVIFFIAAATDFIDGYIARRFNAESDFGVFLDPLADKFLTFAGFICLPFLDPSQFPLWAILLIVVRDVAITALRIFANRKGVIMQTRYMAKVKTAIQMMYLYIALIFGLLMLFRGRFGEMIQIILDSNVFYTGLMLVMIITLYSGIEYIVVNRALFSSQFKKS
ncbi:CDP-diacylglycerol--glycerol-3-phosphate 3-phosphatidyltransferase [Rhodohalobacter sulfatireducens]|uniref:CDP-diacylglycerol--glycerol-3-phosphate 3-phosphatidyltransferase n=1 Tax=Rhodohalobacter sulfatireducens TaxID=2911366 RepID=A0ABS9KI17_9BACT|nr:CDP-diacylglycerol--glycerol-3-phosphate 3-phosphatidyltransferase [Rhodohalobacter sulfatireducens]MCG2590485.1 CDP-diacylglycerol--glycerol-3-phosphate 3-phosphatidyltransferase [Rhodohalobacter sulfatireducens]